MPVAYNLFGLAKDTEDKDKDMYWIGIIAGFMFFLEVVYGGKSRLYCCADRHDGSTGISADRGDPEEKVEKDRILELFRDPISVVCGPVRVYEHF